VEFASMDVAEIVAETMNGYLIHPHRIVCKVVEVDEDKVWIGANKVFKKVPWKKINRENLEGKRTKEKWEDLVVKEGKRNAKRNEKIKEMGIDYEYPLPGKKRKVEGKEEGQSEKKKSKVNKSEKKVTSKGKKKVQKE
jgi:nucleolar protein 15